MSDGLLRGYGEDVITTEFGAAVSNTYNSILGHETYDRDWALAVLTSLYEVFDFTGQLK